MADEIKEIDIQVSINEDINEASFILAPKSAQNMNEIYAAHLEEKIGGQIKAYKEDVECALDIVRNSEKEIEDFRTTIEESKIKCENAEEKSQNALTEVNNRANLNLSNLTEEGEAHFDNRYVNIAGDTMTGNLIIKNINNNVAVRLQTTNIAYNETITTNGGMGHYDVLDKNGDWIAIFGTEKYTDGRNQAKMQVKGIDGTQARVNLRVYADGKTGCDFPRCNTKPTTTSSARGDLVAVVVQNYLNGTSGYRVWTDGYCEQWGFVTTHNATVTLLKSYSDTNYAITLGTADFAGGTYASTVHTRTKNSFIVYTLGDDRNCFWKTCGYIN